MSDTAHQWIGQVVDGKFPLREFVGSSPRSWVFVTERDGQKSAIKLISANQRQSDGWIWRWEQARNLSHPNLIRIFETGRCRVGDTPLIYVVMEYAEENLADILAQRALTSAEAADMLPPVLDALAYLHGKGRVHGHIKPANILASGDQLKISSDGICAMAEVPVQSSAYDAPEVAKRGYSSAGDVWSLGLSVVETLTQKLPSISSNAADDPAVPNSLPQPFLDIARECLRRDPKRRATVADISARLHAPESVTQEPVTVSEPAPRAVAPSAPNVAPKMQKSRREPANWRSAAPAAVLVVLAIIVILVAPKLLNKLQGHAAGAAAVEPSPTATEHPAAIPSETAPSSESSTAPATGASESAQPAVRPPATESTQPSPTSTPKNANKTREDKAVASPAPPPPVPPAVPANKPIATDEVIQQVLPDVPQKALDTIQGTVKVGVRVQVDASGNVTDASLDSAGPSKYFANLAVAAARKWKFSPASDGSGARECVLRFQFKQDGPKATPSSATPRN